MNQKPFHMIIGTIDNVKMMTISASTQLICQHSVQSDPNSSKHEQTHMKQLSYQKRVVGFVYVMCVCGFSGPFLGGSVQQFAHHVQRLLQRFGVTRGARRVRRIERRHAEHDLVRMRIVRATVAFRRHRSVAHEAVGRAGNLFFFRMVV